MKRFCFGVVLAAFVQTVVLPVHAQTSATEESTARTIASMEIKVVNPDGSILTKLVAVDPSVIYGYWPLQTADSGYLPPGAPPTPNPPPEIGDFPPDTKEITYKIEPPGWTRVTVFERSRGSGGSEPPAPWRIKSDVLSPSGGCAKVPAQCLGL